MDVIRTYEAPFAIYTGHSIFIPKKDDMSIVDKIIGFSEFHDCYGYYKDVKIEWRLGIDDNHGYFHGKAIAHEPINRKKIKSRDMSTYTSIWFPTGIEDFLRYARNYYFGSNQTGNPRFSLNVDSLCFVDKRIEIDKLVVTDDYLEFFYKR